MTGRRTRPGPRLPPEGTYAGAVYRTLGSDAGASWDAWGARNHGPGWEATRLRYWRNHRTKKTCVWRPRPGCEGRATQLNHLTYRFAVNHPRHGAGWVRWPWYRLVLRPMCAPCHEAETLETRRRRPGMRRKRQRWAHAYVTYGYIWRRFLLRVALAVGVVVIVAAAGLWMTGYGR